MHVMAILISIRIAVCYEPPPSVCLFACPSVRLRWSLKFPVFYRTTPHPRGESHCDPVAMGVTPLLGM